MVSRLDSTIQVFRKKRNYAQKKDGFDLNLAKSKSYAGQRKCRWNQNLPGKLGQKTPSVGTLLAYLETMA